VDEISSDRLEPAAGIPTTQPQRPQKDGAKRPLRRARREAEPVTKTPEVEIPAEPIPHKVDSLA